MSNVKKNQRSEITPVKFKYELDLISDKIIQFLIRDFGVAELSPNLKIFTNNAKMVGEDIEALKNLVTNYNLAIENNYQYWLVEEFRRRVLTCLDNVLTDVDYAYSMYPTTVYEYNVRRSRQNDAIGGMYHLKNIFQQICRIFPVNFKAYIPFISNIDNEIGLLKTWRRDGNKLYSGCMENDVSKTLKPTTKTVANIVFLYNKYGNATLVSEALCNVQDQPWSLTYRIDQIKSGNLLYDPKRDADIMNYAMENYRRGTYSPIYNEDNQFTGFSRLVPGVMFADENGNIKPIYGNEFNERFSA